MLPQQANLQDWAEGQIEKMRKPVQVSTACQFVKTQKRTPNFVRFPPTIPSAQKGTVSSFFVEFTGVYAIIYN